MGWKFKFRVQDSDLEYLFWRFEKHIALSEKKTTISRYKIQSAIMLLSIYLEFISVDQY